MILYRLEYSCCHCDMSLIVNVSYTFQLRSVVYVVILFLEAVRDEEKKKKNDYNQGNKLSSYFLLKI
jgi:hypothetical protein